MAQPIEHAGEAPALVLCVPPQRIPPPGPTLSLTTPYGTVAAWRSALGAAALLWLDASASPLALLYAAKESGARRVVELVPTRGHNRLLEPGDLVLPDDLVDRSQLERYTFFAGKGYGFLSQREPFCPELRAALLTAARQHTPRAFARAVYLAGPAEQAAAWDCDLSGVGVVPASYLARELELCYAVVALVEPVAPHEALAEAAGDARHALAWLDDVLVQLPAERACSCARAMQQYRDRGDIGPDWHTWLG